jgi:hypothetical protein
VPGRLAGARGAEHLGHPVAHVALPHGGGRAHRHEREHLEQVALDHVPQRARAVVVAGAVLEGEVLVVDDLHAVDVRGVPHRLEEPVGEAQPEDVQHRALAEEVVHPVHVVLRHEPREELVEAPGGLAVGPERLLHDEAGAGGQLALRQCVAGALGGRGRQREVEGHGRLARLEEAPQVRGLGDVGGQVHGLPLEPPERGRPGLLRLGPDALPRRDLDARGDGERLPQPRAPALVVPVLDPGAHEREVRRLAGGEQPAQAGQEETPGEVAARAEDEEGPDLLASHARHRGPPVRSAPAGPVSGCPASSG